MWMSASQALRSARVRERLPAIQARALARRAIPIPPNLPLAEAIRRADLAQARALVVVDHDAKPIAIVNEGAVIATPEQRRPWIDAGSLARTLDPDMILSADLSGMDLIEAVRRAPGLGVPAGRAVGPGLRRARHRRSRPRVRWHQGLTGVPRDASLAR